LALARQCPAGDKEERARLLGIGVAAIEPFLGPDVPCGQSFQAELLRMRGELLLERDGLAAAGEALACFQQAMQLGRDQGALAWELRAAMSLVRLRQSQGHACAAELVEARQYLAAVYGRFTEGFAFPDLQEAAALIGGQGEAGP
jgi:predicted ATPase